MSSTLMCIIREVRKRIAQVERENHTARPATAAHALPSA
jgi:hypothetical protein